MLVVEAPPAGDDVDAEQCELGPVGPMCRRALPLQKTSLGEQERTGTHRGDPTGERCCFTQPVREWVVRTEDIRPVGAGNDDHVGIQKAFRSSRWA